MSTLASLQVIFKDNLDIAPDAVSAEVKLETLDIDSLSMIEILFAVEDVFKIVIPSEPASWRDTLLTVGDLVAYVDRIAAAQGAEQCHAELVS